MPDRDVPSPNPSGRDWLDQLRAVGEEIVIGVERELPGWAQREVARVLDAWNRLPPDEIAAALERARAEGQRSAIRVGHELRGLFELDPAGQKSTPLQIVRSATAEPAALLAALGIPEVVRDPFDERANPADVYDLAPRSLGDLGDPTLAPLLLAWGIAKARVLRERASDVGE